MGRNDLTKNQPAPGKVIITRSDTETNSFWASIQDTNAAVIMTRNANLSWYYLTDARFFALRDPGNNSAARIPITAMVTSSSTQSEAASGLTED